MLSECLTIIGPEFKEGSSSIGYTEGMAALYIKSFG